MAGGIGSRFWPMSRTSYPKQFHDVLGTGSTLIQQTFERFLNICPKENIYVVTSDIYRELVLEQLDGIPEENVLLEPSRRNTAPCIAYAAHKINKINPLATMIVAPSDHMVLKEVAFVKTIEIALNQAIESKGLVTLGIKPSRPDTGYGYIQFNDEIAYSNEQVKKVKTFTEKPDLSLARTFLKSGDFYWNSGIFIWTVQTIISAFENHLPDINSLFVDIESSLGTGNEAKSIEGVYSVCESISIDYGLLEKAEKVFVVLSDFGWSDLGTWGSLFAQLKKDKSNNAVVGNNVIFSNSDDNMVSVPEEKLVFLNELNGYIVVDTDDVLLICPKKDEQKIKQIVNDLKVQKKTKFI